MRFVVLTPQAVVLDQDVAHVRAEDPSGAFGVLDRYADLLTALTILVLVYRDRDRREHFIALRGGMLTVSGRGRVDVLAREAVASDDLQQLERDVLVRFRRTFADEKRARREVSPIHRSLRNRLRWRD